MSVLPCFTTYDSTMSQTLILRLLLSFFKLMQNDLIKTLHLRYLPQEVNIKENIKENAQKSNKKSDE